MDSVAEQWARLLLFQILTSLKNIHDKKQFETYKEVAKYHTQYAHDNISYNPQ